MLARILIDHRLLTTDLGVLAITCAAFDDVTGWLILAGILSLLHGGDPHIFWLRLMLFLGYLAVMMLVVRPALRWAAGELVILNIGIELRILSPVVYSMLVLMALFTTVITSPIITQLRLAAPRR